MHKLRKITVIGLGVIGGSLGLALKVRYPEIHICGMDVKPETIKAAKESQAIDEGVMDIAESVKDADLVFLAVPMPVMERVCCEIAPYLKKGAIVTDTGSTKVNIVSLMARTLPPGISFLGGHPMAGSEKTGFTGATELLFENAAYILTPLPETREEVTMLVHELVSGLGARVLFLTPEEHDRKVAAVSHLPHVAASSLVMTVGSMESMEGGYFSLAAVGFRDSTRIAASDGKMWSDILLQNSKALLPLIANYKAKLGEFEAALENGDQEALYELLDEAKRERSKVPTGMKGILPQIFELNVMVPDIPGAIGKLAILLGSHGINISDIEIMRVRDENDGTIRLGFGLEDHRDKALQVLAENGFTTRKSWV